MGKRKALTKREYEEVFKTHGYKCAACGCDKRENLVVHHVLPISLGGDNRPSNLQLLCVKCHQRVHNGISFKSLREQGISCAKAGRPSVYSREDAEDYLFCRLSGQALKEKRSSGQYIADAQILAALKEELGVVKSRNNVGCAERNPNIDPQKIVGWIKFSDGSEKIFRASDTEACQGYRQQMEHLKEECLCEMEQPFLEWLSTKQIQIGA